MPPDESGCYQLENGVISYRSANYGSWQLPVSEVSVIGEYTTEDGPFADDRFLVFVPRNGPDGFEGSFDGEGREELLQELSTLLDTELSPESRPSTTFTSRILWPAEMQGGALFDFQPCGPFKVRRVLAIAGSEGASPRPS